MFADEMTSLTIDNKICGDYEVTRVLGRGSYGEVSLVKSPSGRSLAAKKSIRMVQLGSGAIPAPDFYTEVDLLMRFDHPNVMSAEDYYYSGRESCAILPVAETDLAALIKKYHSLDDHVPDCETLFEGCCRGLAYLHANLVLHEDIKPANILVVNGVPKISDFGSAKTLSSPMQKIAYTREIVTSWWRPPELFYEPLDGSYRYGLEVDVWSMMMVGIELVGMVPPFGAGYGGLAMVEEIHHSGAYLPPQLEATVAGAPKVTLLKFIGFEDDPDMKTDYPKYYEWVSAIEKSIASPPENRMSAQELYELTLEFTGNSAPTEALTHRMSRIAYGGAFTPEFRETAVGGIKRFLASAPRAFLLAVDIFDRVSTELNSTENVLRLNAMCAMFLAGVVLDVTINPSRDPDFPEHLGKVLEVLKFRIYRPDATQTLGVDLETAVAITTATLSPEEVTF